MSGTINRIIVVGRDAPVWLTAVALQRALGDRIELTVLELPTLTLATGVYAAVPAIAQLHSAIGIDQAALAAATNATPMVAQRYANWSRSAPFVHGYDAGDSAQPLLGLVQHWVKARSLGLRAAFEDFSLASAAAKSGKVPAPTNAMDERAPVPGCQFDARSYAAALKSLALRRGIEHRSGHLAGVRREGNRITAIEWEEGEEFAGDLFIDASGAEALLIGPASR